MRVEDSDIDIPLELPAFGVCGTWKSQAREGSRSTQNSKVSVCVQKRAGVLYILASSQVCPLQGEQGDLERRDQSRTHCVHTHPSLKQHSNWFKGERMQQARTDGELLGAGGGHVGVHVVGVHMDRRRSRRQITWRCSHDRRPRPVAIAY